MTALRAMPLAFFSLLVGLALTEAAEILPQGHRPAPLGIHALVEATLIPRPGEKIEKGVVVIRDGLIEALGAAVVPLIIMSRRGSSMFTVTA